MLVPKLRFKREDGISYPEWNNQKLSAISSRVTRKNKGNITDIPLTIASLYGLVDQREYFKKTIASQNMEGYYLLRNGEFAYNKSYSKGFDFGAIKRLDRYDCGALSTLYICFAVNNKVNSDFMSHYFDSQKWNKEVSIRCAEGARNHGLLNISTDDFFDIDMTLPTNLEEQQKIANFLSNVDKVITQSEEEVQNLVKQKKAAIQKIFLRVVRFKREDGTKYPEWMLRQISDFANCFAGGTPSTTIREYWEDGIISWLSSGEVNKKQIFETDKKISKLGYDKSSTKMVKPNSVVIALAGQGKTRGTVAITRIPVCTNQSLCAIETDDTVIGDYLYQYLGTRYDDLRNISSGDGIRGGLNLKLINGYSVPIPCLEEQRKIADILFAYDEAIDYAKQELEKWKELKKGLLQQMFV